jgi:hypothetical protein
MLKSKRVINFILFVSCNTVCHRIADNGLAFGEVAEVCVPSL